MKREAAPVEAPKAKPKTAPAGPTKRPGGLRIDSKAKPKPSPTTGEKRAAEAMFTGHGLEASEQEIADIASLSCDMAAVDIVEVYSPQRFTASDLGLRLTCVSCTLRSLAGCGWFVIRPVSFLTKFEPCSTLALSQCRLLACWPAQPLSRPSHSSPRLMQKVAALPILFLMQLHGSVEVMKCLIHPLLRNLGGNLAPQLPLHGARKAPSANLCGLHQTCTPRANAVRIEVVRAANHSHVQHQGRSISWERSRKSSARCTPRVSPVGRRGICDPSSAIGGAQSCLKIRPPKHWVLACR